MAAIDKLVERFKEAPADFTWSELVKLLASLGYQKKKAKGSRGKFIGDTLPAIYLHEPHLKNIVKRYALKCVRETLESEGLL